MLSAATTTGLAVQLTGWKIDIKSESKMRELAQWLAEALSVDIEWLRTHTDIDQRARRWSDAGRPWGLQLRSPELEDAERWIASRLGKVVAEVEAGFSEYRFDFAATGQELAKADAAETFGTPEDMMQRELVRAMPSLRTLPEAAEAIAAQLRAIASVFAIIAPFEKPVIYTRSRSTL